ncbi:MAG: type II toxin-antitoxin system VapC family toxin [Acidobacteriota bacterium]
MKLLLDTHIWIWSLLSPQKLGRRVARELESSRNERWLSPISLWEAQILFEKGRLRKPQDLVRWIEEALETTEFHDAPLTRAVALESRRIALSTEDPADRFLAATAKVYDLTLVTADERLLALREIKILPNRL